MNTPNLISKRWIHKSLFLVLTMFSSACLFADNGNIGSSKGNILPINCDNNLNKIKLNLTASCTSNQTIQFKATKLISLNAYSSRAEAKAAQERFKNYLANSNLLVSADNENYKVIHLTTHAEPVLSDDGETLQWAYDINDIYSKVSGADRNEELFLKVQFPEAIEITNNNQCSTTGDLASNEIIIRIEAPGINVMVAQNGNIFGKVNGFLLFSLLLIGFIWRKFKNKLGLIPSSNNTELNDIKSLVAEGELKMALEHLLSHRSLKRTSNVNHAILLKSRLKNVSTEFDKGLIDPQTLYLERNRIADSMLNLLSRA